MVDDAEEGRPGDVLASTYTFAGAFVAASQVDARSWTRVVVGAAGASAGSAAAVDDEEGVARATDVGVGVDEAVALDVCRSEEALGAASSSLSHAGARRAAADDVLDEPMCRRSPVGGDVRSRSDGLALGPGLGGFPGRAEDVREGERGRRVGSGKGGERRSSSRDSSPSKRRRAFSCSANE